MPYTIKQGRFGTTVVTFPDGTVKKFENRDTAKAVAEREARFHADTVVDLDQPERARRAAVSRERRDMRNARRMDRFELIAEEVPFSENEDDGLMRITLYALGPEAKRWAIGLGDIAGLGEFESCGADCAYLEMEYTGDDERAAIGRDLRRSGLQYVFAHDYVPRGAQSKLITLRRAQELRRSDRRYRRQQRIRSGNYQRGRRR